MLEPIKTKDKSVDELLLEARTRIAKVCFTLFVHFIH